MTLAIGRKGQNVKLASKLLGWKIDIFTESRYGELHAARQTLEQVANVVEINIERFLEAGFDSLEEVARACEMDGAAGVFTAVLVAKERAHRREADFVGVRVPDRYLFGYGLDYRGYFRNAPGIFAVADVDV